MDQIGKLRALAAWYRELAEQAENRTVRRDRLRTAEFLEREAAHSELAFVSPAAKLRNWGVRPLS